MDPQTVDRVFALLTTLNPTIDRSSKIVVLNPNASKRFPMRRLPLEDYARLAVRLLEDPDVYVVMTGVADEKADADWPMPDAEVDGRHDSQPGNMGTAVRGQKHRRAGGAEMAISANISPISWSRWRLRHSTDLSKPWWRQV